MLDGSFWRTALIAILLLAPVAAAAPPAKNLDAPTSLEGQDLTDFALDSTGQFGMAVVALSAKIPGTLLTPPDAKRDVYPCNFGPATTPTSGQPCRGLNHGTSVSGTPGAGQSVDATSYPSTGGVAARYAVGGPGPTISLWSHSQDTALWTKSVGDNFVVVNVSVAPEGKRVAAGLSPSSMTGGGRIAVFDGASGNLLWDYNLTESGVGVRPTSLDWSRSGGILAVGTSSGVFLFQGDGTRPTSAPGGITSTGLVHKVVLSEDGSTLAVAAANGVFYAHLRREGGKVLADASSVYNRQFNDGAATDVAMSLDGARFAAVSGNKIHFFARNNTAVLAEPVGDAFDAGAKVADITYDAKGSLLVAIAGDNVYGFGRSRNAPIWSFTATKPELGALDGPLRKVAVSDGAERVVVAGKTKLMVYGSVVNARGVLASPSGATTIAPATEFPLTLTVTNTGSLPDNYTLVVNSPVGWSTSGVPTLSLDPEQSGQVNFTVAAPAGQTPGSFGVEVRIRSQAQLAATGRSDVWVAGAAYNLTVPRSVALVVEVEDEKIELRQGGDFTLPLKIRNQGNAEGVVNLSATQETTRGASWDIRFSSPQLRIRAGESVDLSMLITAPADGASGERNIITVHAKEGTTVDAKKEIIAYVDPIFGAELRTTNTTLTFAPGDIRTVSVTIQNVGNTEDVYNLTQLLTPVGATNDWRVTLDREQVTIPRGETRTVGVTVKPAVSEPRDATLTLRTQSQSDPEKREDTLVLTLLAAAPEPTDDDDRLLPLPAPLWIVALVAAVALLRRGGRQ